MLFSCLRSVAGGAFAVAPGDAPKRARLLLDGHEVDDVLVVDRGAHGVEIHLHGAPAVLALLAHRFRWSEEPPLSPALRLRREAIGVQQLDLALEQASTDFASHLEGLQRLSPTALRAEVQATIRRSRAASAMTQPRRLVLVGAQNAGKSTLFNRLLFRERVLTGPAAGLTRDPVAEVTVLDGYPYEVVDTAGAGDFASELEARAFVAGQRYVEHSIVCLVVDAQRGPGAVDRAMIAAFRGPVLALVNKCDLPAVAWPEDLPEPLSVSAATDPATVIRARVGARLRALRRLPVAGPVGGPAALDEAQRRALWALARRRGALGCSGTGAPA